MEKEVFWRGMQLISLILICAISIIFYIQMHESAHQTIATYFGCSYSDIGMELSFGKFMAYTEITCDKWTDTHLLANSLLDIIGYTLFPFYILLSAKIIVFDQISREGR